MALVKPTIGGENNTWGTTLNAALDFLNAADPYIDVVAEGAIGDGTTDDGATINSIITASPEGSTIYFPGNKTYATTVPIALRGRRRYVFGGVSMTPGSYGATIKQKNGSAITSCVVGTYNYINNVTSGDDPIVVEGLTVDVNKANCPSSTAHGLVIMSFWSRFERIAVNDSPASGILFTDRTANGTRLASGTTGSENRLDDFRIKGCQYAVRNEALAGNNCQLDGTISRGYIQDCDSAIRMDVSAGWHIRDVHAYGIPITSSTISSLEGVAFRFTGCYATLVDGLYLEDFGSAAVSGTYYYGIQMKVLNGRASRISNCTIACDDSSGVPAWYSGLQLKAGSSQTTAMVQATNIAYLGNGATASSRTGVDVSHDSGGVITVDAANINVRSTGRSFSWSSGDVLNFDHPGIQNLAYAASITPEPGYGSTIVVGTLTGGITVNAPQAAWKGAKLRFVFTQDGTGGRAVTWNAVFKVNWTPTTTANKINTIEFVYDGTNWVQTATAVGM